MKDSEILWAARDRVDQGWCKHQRTDGFGNVCVAAAIGAEVDRDEIWRLMDYLRDTLNGHSAVAFNDNPNTSKRDVLDLLEKTAIRLEEHGL